MNSHWVRISIIMEEKFEATSLCSVERDEDVPAVDASQQMVQEEVVVVAEEKKVSKASEKYKGNPSKVNKKVIKHALRQQAKRRRKNTTIAAGGGSPNVPLHRTSSSPHCELEEMTTDTSNYRQPSMAEVISSIPGFHLRVPSRKRSNKKLSAAALIEQTRDGCVDLESPDSILAGTNLKSLLNRHTFASLPQLYQYKLLQLLPPVDRVPTQTETMYRCSSTALTNEFFARACEDWRERLAEGEFTPENQAKLKAEQEKEKTKLDPWKLKHFEPMWGESLREWPTLPPGTMGIVSAASNLQTLPGLKKDLSKSLNTSINKIGKEKPLQPAQPVRTVGAVTRAVTSYREKKAAQESCSKTDYISSPDKETLESLVFIHTSPDSTADNHIVLVVDKKEEIFDQKMDSIEVDCVVEDHIEYVIDDGSDPVVVLTDVDNTNEVAKEVEVESSVVALEDSMDCEPETLSTEMVSELPQPGVAVSSVSADNESLPRKRRTPDRMDPPQSTPPKVVKNYRHESREAVEVILDPVEDTVANDIPRSSMKHEEVLDCLAKQEQPESLRSNASTLTVVPDDTIKSTTTSVDASAHDKTIKPVLDTVERESIESDLEPISTISKSGQNDHNLVDDSTDSSLEPLSIDREQSHSQEMTIKLDQNLEVQVESSGEVVPLGPTSDDQDFEVDKTLRDVVALEQEVADRQSGHSVKAEALNHSTSRGEKWEVIAVDPNDGTSEVACSTANDPPIETSMSTLPGLSAYGNVLYQEDEELKEDEAAILAAAWDVVGSSSEFQHQVSAIPCQEELEVRIQESSLPAPEWNYNHQDAKGQPQGHVKLELEVTLTPEVDSSTVSSTCGSGNESKNEPVTCGTVDSGLEMQTETESANTDVSEKSVDSPSDIQSNPSIATSYDVMSPKAPPSSVSPTPSGQTPVHRQQQLQVVVCSNEGPGVTVIPPTTIVCLPGAPVTITSSHHPPPPHHHHRPLTSVMTQGSSAMAQSSPVLPFIALTTSTPVRALVTKSVTKSSGRTGRNHVNSSKPPPGAVNLERSYQICQAVIQNSPNRHQLRCQLKPPPSLLAKTGVTNNPPAANRVPSTVSTAATATNRGGGRVGIVQPHSNAAAPTSRSHVVYRHVFASSVGGIPVNMAVLPPVHSSVHQEVMRGLELRRSNSAPPHSAEATRGVRPPSAPPLPPPFAASASPANSGGGSSNCACSMRAMIACSMCGAFCHDDCLISPTSRLCVMCYDTR